MNLSTKAPHIVGVLLAGLAIITLQPLHKEMQHRIEQQQKHIETRQQWNNEYQAIQPLQMRWKASIPPANSEVFADQHRMTQHIAAGKYQLAMSETGITLTDASPLTHDGRPIGIMRYPIGNSGPNLVLTAADYNTAWTALRELQERPDVRYTRARIDAERGSPTLTLENFALLGRIEP